MFIKSFTNLRTLSLAIVMAAMLMVGIFIPASPANAQLAVNYSASSEAEQRAALMEQVQQLMVILMQMMAQMEGQRSTMNDAVSETNSPEDAVEYLSGPEITLLSPNGKQTFDKSERNDDVIIKWQTENVPANTNVIIEIELIEAYAGTFITGGVTQVRAKEGVQEHRKVIDRNGTLGAGEYKVRLALEECHSTGCDKSYSFGPRKEQLKVYDKSQYGYFTVVDSELFDVRLSVSGFGDPKTINLNTQDSITVNHYPVGDIDECVVTGEYEKGNQITKSSWPNTIKAGQYGRTSFYAVGENGVLEEVRVKCEDLSGRTVATDSISFIVDRGDTGSYEILLNGEVVMSDRSSTEADSQSACRATYNNYDKYNFKFGDVVECKWNGKVFKTVDGWKG